MVPPDHLAEEITKRGGLRAIADEYRKTRQEEASSSTKRAKGGKVKAQLSHAGSVERSETELPQSTKLPLSAIVRLTQEIPGIFFETSREEMLTILSVQDAEISVRLLRAGEDDAGFIRFELIEFDLDD